MKRLAFAMLFSVLTVSAYAQSAVNPAPESDQAKATAETVADTGKAGALDRNCLRETGTHIRHKNKKGCVDSSPGQVYTRRDIDSTGATDVGSALDRLSPSLRVRRN